MRRAVLAVVAAACACPLLAGCGNSAAEDAYLADLQKASAFTELPDPDGDLKRGHEVCGILGDTKPENRVVAAATIGQQRGYGFDILFAATRNLCPEYKVTP